MIAHAYYAAGRTPGDPRSARPGVLAIAVQAIQDLHEVYNTNLPAGRHPDPDRGGTA